MENKGIFDVLGWLFKGTNNNLTATKDNSENKTGVLEDKVSIKNADNSAKNNATILAPLPPLNEKMLKTMSSHQLFVERVYKKHNK